LAFHLNVEKPLEEWAISQRGKASVFQFWIRMAEKEQEGVFLFKGGGEEEDER